jgi:dihydroorotase
MADSDMMSGPDLVMRNVRFPSGRIADLTLSEGKVVRAGSAGRFLPSIDCTSLIVIPAAVDMHVHMRGGSQSRKEDWGTGTESAIAGGVTIVVDQPNTIPAIDTPELLARRVAEAERDARCGFAINSAVTGATPIDEMWSAGAMAFGETFFGPSSYGEPVSEVTMAASLERIHAVGGLATVHAEIVMQGGADGLAAHDRNRPGSGEVRAIEQVKRLNPGGCRIHFCHMSTGPSIAAAAGTVEVTPHHLFLSRERFSDDDAHEKVNPPLRSEKERKGVWQHWEEIDVIASDHAPHTREEKSQDFANAPSGIPGVETMVPLLMAEVLHKRITLDSVIRKTAAIPAEILGIPPAGFNPGDRADFALYPKEIGTVEADQLHSKCGWTPFEDFEAVFPDIVVMGGELVFQDREFFPARATWYPGKGYARGT